MISMTYLFSICIVIILLTAKWNNIKNDYFINQTNKRDPVPNYPDMKFYMIITYTINYNVLPRPRTPGDSYLYIVKNKHW